MAPKAKGEADQVMDTSSALGENPPQPGPSHDNDTAMPSPPDEQAAQPANKPKRKASATHITSRKVPRLEAETGADLLPRDLDDSSQPDNPFELEPHGLPPQYKAKSLERFLRAVEKNGIKVNTDLPHEYKLPDPELKDILQLPVQSDRSYEVVVEDGQVDRDGILVDVWRLFLRDTNDPDNSAIQLFRDYRRSFEVSALDKALFSREDVENIGQHGCAMVERLPCAVDTDSYADKSYKSIRNFIDLVSLYRHKPNFDVSSLHGVFSKEKNGVYTGQAISKKPGGALMSQYLPMSLELLPGGNGCRGVPTISRTFNLRSMDQAKVDQLADPGSSFHGRYTGDDTESDKGVVIVLRNVRKDMIGKVGSLRRLQRSFDAMVAAKTDYNRPDDGNKVSAGGLNGNKIFKGSFKARSDGNGSWLRLSRSATRTLLVKTPPKDFPKTDASQLDTTSAWLETRTASFSKLEHAYIMQGACDKLAEGAGLLNALQEVHVRCALVDHRVVSEQGVLESICTDLSKDSPHEHVCLGSCGDFRLCGDLEFDEHGHRLCSGCLGRPVQSTISLRTAKGMLHMRLLKARKSDEFYNLPLPSQDEMVAGEKALAERFILSDDIWIDGLDKRPVTMSSAVWTETSAVNIKGRYVAHPRQMSLDKRFPFWLGEDGIIYGHHPDNLLPVKLGLNYLRGRTAFVVTPYFGEGARRVQAWEDQGLIGPDVKPFLGYPTEDDEDFFEAFEAVADCSLMIQFGIPNSRFDRSAASVTREEFEEFKAVWHTGLWDGTMPACYPFLTRADLFHVAMSDVYKMFTMWTAEDIKRIKGMVKKIEAYFSITVYKVNDVPFLWKPNEAPDNWSWKLLFREVISRLVTWTDFCDRENDTDETPETVLECFIVQWCEKGGKCHILGTRFSIFAGHALVYSFGRAVAVVDENGKFVRDIQAGEELKTGWKKKKPTEFPGDYDWTRRTMVVETFRGNNFRLDFPNKGGKMLHLQEIIQGIPDHPPPNQTLEWPPISAASSFRKVPFPKIWDTNLSRVTRAYNGGEVVGSVDDDSVDEEVAVLRARHAAPASINDIRVSTPAAEDESEDQDNDGDGERAVTIDPTAVLVERYVDLKYRTAAILSQGMPDSAEQLSHTWDMLWDYAQAKDERNFAEMEEGILKKAQKIAEQQASLSAKTQETIKPSVAVRKEGAIEGGGMTFAAVVKKNLFADITTRQQNVAGTDTFFDNIVLRVVGAEGDGPYAAFPTTDGKFVMDTTSPTPGSVVATWSHRGVIKTLNGVEIAHPHPPADGVADLSERYHKFYVKFAEPLRDAYKGADNSDVADSFWMKMWTKAVLANNPAKFAELEKKVASRCAPRAAPALLPRSIFFREVPHAVPDDHIMHHTMVVSGAFHQTEYAFPTTNGEYVTIDGDVLATWDEAQQDYAVWSYLGAYMGDPVRAPSGGRPNFA